MHRDELAVDGSLVLRLLCEQFPEWSALAVERVDLAGTDNALFRLGAGMVVRLPRRARVAESLAKECEWLPWLAPQLPLAIPVPLGRGAPTAEYPFGWAVYPWLAGERATPERITDEEQFASDLAGFIAAFQAIDPTGGPRPGDHNFHRGVPLGSRDHETRQAIEQLAGRIDAEGVSAVWDEAMAAPAWDRPPVWIHGDLDRQNMLVTDGRLSGVIDFGGLAAGDPACDAMVAWKALGAAARDGFRAALDIDHATWARSRGWAVSQAVIALAYYTEQTHPVLVSESHRWIAEVVGSP